MQLSALSVNCTPDAAADSDTVAAGCVDTGIADSAGVSAGLKGIGNGA
jgi:hypothetical protein